MIKRIHLIMYVPKYTEILSDNKVNYLKTNLRVDKNLNVTFIR